MGTLMRIECASNPDRLRSHECALTWCASNAHRMQIRSNPPPEVVWMRIQTGSYYYSWFTRGYAYHEIVGSVGFTRWLGLWRVFIAPFCSALAATLGKRGLFADGQVEWYSMVKLKAQWFRCLQYLNLTYYSRPARCASGASLRTAFQLVLVSWYFIFQSCVAFCCYV